MPSIDLAERVHNHNFRLDPYVRSLLDTDFYKLLMAGFIWRWYPQVRVTFSVKNRSTQTIKLPKVIGIEALRDQLDYVRSLRFTETELIWLQGNTFYGQTGIFPGDFIQALRDLRLPEYRLSIDDTGEYALSFEGSWLEVMLWEIYALSILNEARSRAGMADMSGYQLRILYANATAKLVEKLKRLKAAGVPRIAEFGTRRRHGFLWQGFVLEAMREELGENFLGTSNALHAFRMGLDAIGTNAHELPMVMTAIADLSHNGDKAAIHDAQFDVLRKWERTYHGHLLVALPDTYGSSQFLKGARTFKGIGNWTGFREDSKNPFVAGEEKIAFWQSINQDPREKLQLFSDGLDVDQMINLHKRFGGRIRDGYGWGTLATNDFRGCDPRGGGSLDPISIVCKVSAIELPGSKRMDAVKLSDNYQKATGSPETIERYRAIFGTDGVDSAPVTV